RVRQFGSDPRTNTNDVWLREIEITSTARVICKHGPRRILDFGCANGYTTLQLARQHSDKTFLGVDINPEMITVATTAAAERGVANATFSVLDVRTDPVPGPH